MNRRVFLVTASVGLVAGCSSSGGGSTPTNTATPTQTSTAEPAAYDVSIEAPDRVPVEEQFTVTVEVTNTGGQSGQFQEPVDISLEGESAEPLQNIESNVDPGETASTVVSVPALRQTGQIRLEIPGHDVEATIEVHADDVAPRIQTVTPVSEWEEYGDVADNSVNELRAGDPARIGVRYNIWVHGGEMNATVQTVIRRDGEQVAVDQAPFERLVEGSGRYDWEAAPAFRTDDWETGTHTAEVIVRDEINGEQSARVDATFDVI